MRTPRANSVRSVSTYCTSPLSMVTSRRSPGRIEPPLSAPSAGHQAQHHNKPNCIHSVSPEARYAPAMELLLLSNSRTLGGYLTDYLPEIHDFAKGVRRAVFVPFAAVATPWKEYAGRVEQATGFSL